MPKTCADCPLSFMYPDDFSTNCKLKFGLWNEEYTKMRHKNCPLKEKEVLTSSERARKSLEYKVLQQKTGESSSEKS